MGVQSYLSLYTMLLGWQSYDAIWNILTQLGLVLLPFAFIAVKSFMGPLLSMGAKDAGVIGARRFIFNMSSALAVLMLASAPCVHLKPTVLHFRPHCDKSAPVATPGNTGTTYDNTLPVPNDVKVPIIWYFVMAISNGITDWSEDSISCPAVNLRDLQNELDLTVIQGTALKQETGRFYQECYLPANNKFVEDNDSGINQPAIKAAQQKYGINDTAWVGSEIFQNVPGFYDSFSAKSPVAGFPYQDSGINNQINAQTGTPKWGAPNCKTWWEQSGAGLRAKLFAQFSHKAQAQIAEVAYGGDKTLAEDAAIRAMIEKSTGGNFFSTGYYSEQNNQSGADNVAAKWYAKYAVDKLAVQDYPKIQIVKEALPIVQAVLFAAFCMMLALVIPLASYSINVVITAAVFMFSIIFCSYLWHFVSMIDQFLLQALFTAGPGAGPKNDVTLIKNLAENAINPTKNLVNIVISTFYVFLPMLWLSISGWAGIAAGGLMSFAGIESMAARGGQKGLGNLMPKGKGGGGSVNVTNVRNTNKFGAGSTYHMGGGE